MSPSEKTTPTRTRCEIYSRVMGYYRPVSAYNPGKKSEFYSRTTYSEITSLNSDFIRTYE